MKRAKKLCSVVISFAATLVVVDAADAQQPPAQQQPSQPPAAEPIAVMAEKVSAVATVDKVDMAKRELMLKDDKGTKFQVIVSDDVPNLEAVKKGDKIAVDYYTTMALSLVKSAKGKTPGTEATKVVERIPGPLPSGVVAIKISETVEVVKVDTAANKLTVKNPAGEHDTIHVSDAALQAELAKLKRGDKIRADYTEAVAVAVAPQKQKPKEG